MLCQCGCGNLITYIPRHKYYTPRYIYGHNFRKGYWTGKKRDPETVRKMSRSRLGKPAWNKGKKMLTLHPMLGRHHSIESRKKMSITRKGKPSLLKGIKRPELSGKNNPAWKGGITSFNKLQRKKFRKEIRDLVFKRDNYTCQLCGIKGVPLQVDHIQSWAKYIELRFSLDNCRTLCVQCHYQITFGKPMPKNIKTWGRNFERRELK